MNQIGYHSIALEILYNFVFKLIVIGVEGEPQIDLKVGPFSGIINIWTKLFGLH